MGAQFRLTSRPLAMATIAISLWASPLLPAQEGQSTSQGRDAQSATPTLATGAAPAPATVPTATSAAPSTAASAAVSVPVAGTISAVAVPMTRGLADPGAYVGADIATVLSALGPPEEMSVARGSLPAADDVVFSYQGFDLYWAKDRVWQVRCESTYGLSVGFTEEDVLKVLGAPLSRAAGELIYNIAGRAWPMRLSVSFNDVGIVRALYVYRSDL